MTRMSSTAMMPLGMGSLLVGFALFIIYIGSSAVIAILALLIFSAVGVFLLTKSAPGDS